MRRIFAAFVLVFALIVPLAGNVSAGVARDNEVLTPNREYLYYELRDHYPGGEQALPYGNNDAAGVLTHARGMSAVNGAIATLQARGYVRRPDADGAGTQLGGSFAILAFEKPGNAITQQQPLLVVATQAIEISGVGYRPATRIYAAMFADSAGQVRVVASPADSAMAFIGQLLGPQSAMTRSVNAYFGVPVGPNVTDESISFRYSAYEHAAGTWQYHNTISPEMQALLTLAYQHVAWNVVGGMATGALGFTAGPAAGIAGVLVGGYVGGLVAWKVFWLDHPGTVRYAK
jgi:hypothetical protein